MNFGALPLRAIAFQALFLMLAIALEAVVFYHRLNMDLKNSVRYSTSVNLLSTFVGWVLFFNIQHLLPEALQVQLVSYFFFERFFVNPLSASVAPLLTVLGLGIFFGVIFLELQGIKLLDILLEKSNAFLLGDKQSESGASSKKASRLRFQPLPIQNVLFQKSDSRAFAVLLANALSFSAILFLLLFRWLDQVMQGR